MREQIAIQGCSHHPEDHSCFSVSECVTQTDPLQTYLEFCGEFLRRCCESVVNVLLLEFLRDVLQVVPLLQQSSQRVHTHTHTPLSFRWYLSCNSVVRRLSQTQNTHIHTHTHTHTPCVIPPTTSRNPNTSHTHTHLNTHTRTHTHTSTCFRSCHSSQTLHTQKLQRTTQELWQGARARTHVPQQHHPK